MRSDADTLLAARFALTRDGHDDSDWADVLRRVPRRAPRRRLVLVAAAVLLAIAAPTFALSASLRGLFGLSGGPDLREVRLVVSAPISEGRIARVWVSPSMAGRGTCEFLTVDPVATAPPKPTAMGGGSCTQDPLRHESPLRFGTGHSLREAPIVKGRVGSMLPAADVRVRWRGGSQRLAFDNGYFVAEVPAMDEPPFRRLPFQLVVYDADGAVLARKRIPTSSAYLNFKRDVQPRLRAYRAAHGCDPIGWRCDSR